MRLVALIRLIMTTAVTGRDGSTLVSIKEPFSHFSVTSAHQVNINAKKNKNENL